MAGDGAFQPVLRSSVSKPLANSTTAPVCDDYLHQANLMDVDPVILASARRHGVADEEILHAYRNPIRSIDLPDDNLTLLIGPDHAARLLEIGVSTGDGIEFVIHAMPARDKYLR